MKLKSSPRSNSSTQPSSRTLHRKLEIQILQLNSLRKKEISYSIKKHPRMAEVSILQASRKKVFCLRFHPAREAALIHAKTLFRMFTERRTTITLISSLKTETTKKLNLLMLTLILTSLISDITYRMVKLRENGSWSTHQTMIALRFTSAPTTRAGVTLH